MSTVGIPIDGTDLAKMSEKEQKLYRELMAAKNQKKDSKRKLFKNVKPMPEVAEPSDNHLSRQDEYLFWLTR